MKFEINKAVSEKNYLEIFCEKIFTENNFEENNAIKGMPQRMAFETKIWNIGEIIRTKIKDKDKRTDNDDTIPLFELILNDKDIYGFGIAELNKMKLYVLSEKIEKIYELEKTGWIKREIKKYLKNIGNIGNG